MRLTHWSPWSANAWNQFNALQNEVNRIFERSGGVRPDTAVFPLLNLREHNDVFYLDAELPGLELPDLDVTVTGPNQLTLKGERKPMQPNDGTLHRQERLAGRFVRTVTLPAPIDADKVDARFENGVLKIALPKHEAAKPRKIAVKA